MEITCPSGLTGIIRGMTVGEAGRMANRKAARRGDATDRILMGSWVETLDPGPYTLAKDGSLDWSKVLIADRFFATMMVRVATHGPDFDFRVQCEACQQSIDWFLKLTDLPVKRVPKASLENFVNGNRFETSVGGKVVTFRLHSGKDELKVQRAARLAEDPLTAVLAHQIIEIQGEKNKIHWIKNLGLATGFELREKFDDVDGGVESDIDVVCDECGTEQAVDLPFGRREFWAPSRKRRKAGRSRIADL